MDSSIKRTQATWLATPTARHLITLVVLLPDSVKGSVSPMSLLHSVKTAMLVPFLGSHKESNVVLPTCGGCYVRALWIWWLSRYKGRLRPSTLLIPKNTLCVNSITESQCITSFSVCAFVLRLPKSRHGHALAGEGARPDMFPRGAGNRGLCPRMRHGCDGADETCQAFVRIFKL